jgi:hypothetical protein
MGGRAAGSAALSYVEFRRFLESLGVDVTDEVCVGACSQCTATYLMARTVPLGWRAWPSLGTSTGPLDVC